MGEIVEEFRWLKDRIDDCGDELLAGIGRRAGLRSICVDVARRTAHRGSSQHLSSSADRHIRDQQQQFDDPVHLLLVVIAFDPLAAFVQLGRGDGTHSDCRGGSAYP
jgi:hypothetical protein